MPGHGDVGVLGATTPTDRGPEDGCPHYRLLASPLIGCCGAPFGNAWGVMSPDQNEGEADALVSAVMDLAKVFRVSGDEARASAVEGSLAGDPDLLPRRVLALFARGMGGILDAPIYGAAAAPSSSFKIDRAATDQRDRLAHALFEEARRWL